jgi:hypothetical protein
LVSLPPLPACIELSFSGCTALTSLPALPLCTWLGCDGCTNLTHISVQDNCKVECDNSPISGHNNDLYLSYINDRSSIVLTAIDQYQYNDRNVVGIIMGFI